jgi:Rrf2 family transcriptional regulator, iron-sulfur cluster assembly transcription factor
MFLSKSFGYALRGILYIAMVTDTAGDKKRVQVDEIADKLSVPRHFLAKIMKRLAEESIIDSTKGPYGGFSLNEKTLSTSLLSIVYITEPADLFTSCVLKFRQCNAKNPCPLHNEFEQLRNTLLSSLQHTNIEKLLTADTPGFIKSLSAI